MSLLALTLCCLAVLCTSAAAGTISGVVTLAGGGPAAGVLVRTGGAPDYSALTGTDGRYALTVPSADLGSWTVLASMDGYIPQRMFVPMTPTSAVTVNFSLRSSGGGAQTLSLPAPLDWGEPPSAPSAPGDSFPAAFLSTGALPAANTPVISGWNETVKPDESFTLTGRNFTTRSGDDAGTDTTVWIWARSSAGGGVLRQARVWRVTAETVVATVPDDVPFGMYLIWVENANGPGAPICVNRTTASWVGPIDNKAYPGQTKRVFGRNLTYNRGITRTYSSDPVVSYVYLQPATGGAFIQCNATVPDHPSAPNLAEPYAVMFTVPVGTSNGNYKVFVHSGHGGSYGWSDGLDLVVQDQWVRGSGVVNLSPRGSGLDDTAAIQNAINTVSGYTNGGTVQLSAGSFILKGQILVKTNVQLAGAGKDSTTIQLQCPPNGTENTQYPNYPTKTANAVTMNGSHITLSELTIHECYGYSLPNCELWMQPSWMGGGPDGVLSNVRVSTDQGDANWVNLNAMLWLSDGGEARGCEFWREIDSGGPVWIHDCTSYGDQGPWYGSESAFGVSGSNVVLENTHAETYNWPVNPDGSTNYNWWDYYYRPWVKRLSLFYCSDSYLAHCTTRNVADQDNKGEMVLLHPHDGYWFGEVVSNSGLTMTVRTDGTVNGAPMSMDAYGGGTVAGGQSVPDTWNWASWAGGRWVVICNGKGIGQIRRLISVTANTITVDTPWLIEPDSTSRAMFTAFYHNDVIYDCELNAFPPNYTQTTSASTGIVFGDCYRCTAEGNTSRRTESARQIQGTNQSGVYWNEMRDETAIDCHSVGYSSYQISYNPMGPAQIGNAFRGCSGNVFASAAGATEALGLGFIVENANMTGEIGYYVGDDLGFLQQWPDSFAMYRNGRITVNDTPFRAAYVSKIIGEGLMVNNSYSGIANPYTYGTGVAGYTLPKPLNRVARFSGYVGYAVQDVIIPVVNAGTIPMTWNVTANDPWITASVQANQTLSPENTLGRLVISASTSGMTAGRHWGSVTLSTGSQAVKIGVCLDVLSGTPANQPPTAAFAATPQVGTAPLLTNFDAGSSTGYGAGIASYCWDFGDGGYGTGRTASHIYATQGTYTPILTVTDTNNQSGQTWKNVTAYPAVTGISLTATPNAPVDAGTTVTLTASATGGYQTRYRFLIKGASGWQVYRDYGTVASCTWTPSAGYYEIKVCAKSADSTNQYDVVSNIITYPVGLIPTTGVAVWLKSDSGVTADAGGMVSSWADQSGAGNTVTQSQAGTTYRPSCVPNVLNGRPVVRFAGGGQVLQSLGRVLSAGTNFTTFGTFSFSSLPASTYQYVWWNGDDSIPGGYGCFVATTPRAKCSWGSSDKAITYQSDIVPGTWYKMASRYSVPTHQAWMNGTSLGTTTKFGSSFTGGVFSVGNFGPNLTKGLYGDVAEILVYNRALSDAEVANVNNYLASRWNPPTPVAIDRLKDAKALGDGVLVSFSSAKIAVSATGTYLDSGVYVTETDRTQVLKVIGAGSVNIGDSLTLTGTTDTDSTGERLLRVNSVSIGANTPVGPYGMSNKTFASVGQFVRVWGKLTATTGSYITIDDGSGAPVLVEVDGLTVPLSSLPGVGSWVSVTGPVGLIAGGVPAVRPRSASDIQVY